MTEPILSADEAVLQRRRFLRGGALVAAAAGGAVAGSGAGALPARADEAAPQLTIAVGPERLLDTRTSAGRELVLASSGSAFDSKHRLKKDAWLDLAVLPTGEGLAVFNAFVTLTSLGSTKGGTLVVARPDDEPTGTTLSYDKGKTVSNAALSGVTESSEVYPDLPGLYVLRISASSVTHVQLDLTGLTVSEAGPDSSARHAARAGLQRVARAVAKARR